MSDIVAELIELLGGKPVFIGWPSGSKGTNKKWGNLTAADMTPDYLATLPGGNIGVALGEVSGGLCAIDWDMAEFVEPFLKANPQLNGTLQTHGARGRVFWVRFKGDYPKRTTKFRTASGEEAGEFRSNGSQSIIWGIHPDTRKPYEFVVKRPAMVDEFDAIEWPAEILTPPSLQRDRDSDVISVRSVSPSSLSLCLSVKSMEHAVEISVPEKEHQNNACLFKLARALKATETRKAALSHEQKLKAFSLWYEKANARGVLRAGQSRDQYLVEFLKAYKKAKTPLGSSLAEQAWALARTEPYPPESAVFETQEGKLLVATCFQLDRAANGEPWFIPSRTAGKLIGTSHPTAAIWLAALVEMGILEVVEAHTSIRATRYRYIHSGKQDLNL